MRMQKGFSIVELLFTVAIIGVFAAILVPSFLRAGAMRDLKTFYDIETVPETAQEKTPIRPYMLSRLMEYERVAKAACEVKTPAEATPAGTGAEATKRVLEYRKNCADATRNLRVARRVYFDDYAIAPKQ